MATPPLPPPPDERPTADIVPAEILIAPPAEPAPEPGLLPRENPVFGLLDVTLITVGTFFLLIFVPALVLGFAKLAPRYAQVPFEKMVEDPLLLIPAQILVYLLAIAFVQALLWGRYNRGITQLVPWRLPRGRWLMLAVFGLGLAVTVELLGRYLPIPKELPIDAYFRTPAGAWVLAIFGVVFAPIAEELYFRGLLYPALNRAAGMAPALVLTSLAFTVLHGSQLAFAWAPLLILFTVGMVLTVVRAKTQSVAASIVVHAAYNATLFAFVFVVTDGFRNMERLARPG